MFGLIIFVLIVGGTWIAVRAIAQESKRSGPRRARPRQLPGQPRYFEGPTSVSPSGRPAVPLPPPASAPSDDLQIVLEPPSPFRPTPTPSPQRKSHTSAQWVPPGRPLAIAGLTVPGGMVYVASSLGWEDPLHDDPSVVDLSLPVARSAPTNATPLGYWPSYRHISAEARRHYLEWLEGGRMSPVDIGYVFVFFYGLERRILVDLRDNAALREEYPLLRQELVRLVSEYGGSSGSFTGYATGLLNFADLTCGNADLSDYRPEDEERQWCCPDRLKYGLGALVAQQQPIPWNWALGWYLCSPQEGCRLRTPAVRCRDEFRQLFAVRYAERFGAGLQLKPNKTKLSMSYHSASSALRSFAADCRGLSDVTALSAPLKKVDAVVQACTDELDAYSRHLGRDRRGEGSLPALSLLPQEILVGHQGAEFAAFRNWTDGLLREKDSAVLRAQDIIAKYACTVAPGEKLARKDMDGLTLLLAKCDLGVEPDPRFGGVRIGPEDPVVLFRTSHSASDSPSADYLVAQLAVHLFWLVASSDGTISRGEHDRLAHFLKGQSRLAGDEQARIRAHIRWIANARPGTSGLKKRIQALSAEQKHHLGQFLVSVALAEGGASPDEVKALSRIYDLLELDENQLHRDIHSQATATAPTDPVLVRQGRQGPGGVPIPAPPEPAGVILDLELVERRERETAQVVRLLEGIFGEEEPIAPAEELSLEECVEGLDRAHSALVRELCGRQSVSRDEWTALAEKHSLLPDGALDTINECALDISGECVCEGDETVAINEQVLKELLT